MSGLVNAITKSRISISKAYIEYCKRRYNDIPQTMVKLHGNKMALVDDLTEDVVQNCLIHEFECFVLMEHGRKNGSDFLNNTYPSFLTKNKSLSSEGVLFMNETMRDAVKSQLKNPKDYNYGLNITLNSVK